MRFLIALLLAVVFSAHAAEPPAPSWPLWDGSESVGQYARRAGLEPNKTLDLGNGIKMEMVLIPAGKFIMGTEEPTESPSMGETITVVSALGALVMVAMPLLRALRQRRRTQFSLRWLILFVIVLGVAQYGGFRWWRAAQAQVPYREAGSQEMPAHEVTLTTPSYMGKFELTQEQYQQVTGTNPSHFKGRDLPVECVSWVEAQEFCRKAAEQTGQLVRLPSEAEWEYACRAGTTTRFSAGDANGDLESAAWFDANSGGTIHPVGQKKPNPWGLYDMPGNVWEWCADRHWSYRAEPATDPPGPLLGPTRVMRGGSWAHHLSFCRSANRDESNPDWRNYTLGFRVLVTLPKTP